jgi:hypothetical protein
MISLILLDAALKSGGNTLPSTPTGPQPIHETKLQVKQALLGQESGREYCAKTG